MGGWVKTDEFFADGMIGQPNQTNPRFNLIRLPDLVYFLNLWKKNLPNFTNFAKQSPVLKSKVSAAGAGYKFVNTASAPAIYFYYCSRTTICS